MSFYKNNNGSLLEGLEIHHKDFILTVEDKTQEINGWKWFDNREDALEEYEIKIEEEDEQAEVIPH